MKKSFRNLCFALGCAAVIIFGVAAMPAPRTVPLHGTFGTTFKLIATDTPGLFDNPINGVGNLRSLGPCTVTIEQTVDFRSNPPILASVWLLTFSDGDQLSATSHGTGTPLVSNPSFFHLAGEGVITGGTGRFKNATGALRFPGVAHVDTAQEVSPAEGHGTFAVEGRIRIIK